MSVGLEDPAAKEVKVSSAVHLPFEHFKVTWNHAVG
jgi:hypothetical protein